MVGLSLEAAQNVDLANISGKAGKELGNFGMMIQDLTKTVPYLTITELVKETLQRSGYREALMAQNNLESQARLENLDEFLSVTQEFDKRFEAQNNDDPNGEETKLADFLTDLALVSDLDNLEESSSRNLNDVACGQRAGISSGLFNGLRRRGFPIITCHARRK